MYMRNLFKPKQLYLQPAEGMKPVIGQISKQTKVVASQFCPYAHKSQ